MRTRGVLAVQPDVPRLLEVPEQRRQLETFAALAAIALERVHYVDVAQHATVQIESERLRNALLSALSHDLRTPLAGLAGLAERLQLVEPGLAAAQQEIAEELVSAAMQMSRQVNNLLDMARFESGEFHLATGWNSIEEIVGSAIRISAPALAAARVRTDVPHGLPLVRCDAVLIERVLTNLLENAGKYAGDGATIEVRVRALEGEMRVEVADDGPGIRAGQEAEIFRKFTRGAAESAIGGVGLGLAICKAIVEAHGGTIAARNRAQGGASFTFALPLAEPAPPVRVDDDELRVVS
jgi:two-component system, OmpR family, sensor histidine kinase KdpD